MPLLYAIARLESVTGINSVVAVGNFFTTQSSLQALKFTLLEATISTIATVIIGLPIAWCLGRYNWKNIKFLRAILAVPFVTPSIVVAMGFLMLIDVGGPLTAMGIDLRLETGIVGDFANVTNWENPGHFIALIAAHVWFNISLIMRFVEPTLSTMDRTWEEQMRFLPAGQDKLSRIRNLWLPIIGPAVLCGATLCFIFSFTSFALVRWLTPNQDTLETMMANSGGSAGIYGYRIDTSEVVLSTSIVQLIILSLAIICATSIQRRHSTMHAIIAESDAKQISDKPNNLVPIICEVASGKRKSMQIFGNDYNTQDGTCIRDYIHVVDLAKAHVMAVNHILNNTKIKTAYNLGVGKGVSVLEVIDSFEKVNNLKISYELGPRRAGDVEKIYSDNTKINEELDWFPVMSFESALESAWNWEKLKNL